VNRNIARFSIVGIVTASVIAAFSISTAYAATAYSACSTTGASGGATFTNWTLSHVDIDDMNVYDTKADGHHVAIRLISGNGIGNTYHYWPWHHNYGGNSSSIAFDTSASDAYGPLRELSVEVATLEGDEELWGCTYWVTL
jgi:hypothetical protein